MIGAAAELVEAAAEEGVVYEVLRAAGDRAQIDHDVALGIQAVAAGVVADHLGLDPVYGDGGDLEGAGRRAGTYLLGLPSNRVSDGIGPFGSSFTRGSTTRRTW